MKQKNGFYFLGITLLISFLASCSATVTTDTITQGNREITTMKEGDKLLHKLIYTIENGKKVRGEYWAPYKESEENAEKNILADTVFAKKFEELLANEKVEDTSGVELQQVKDGLMLKFVKIVSYNSKGLPVTVMNRGISIFPVVGTFMIKNDLAYTYNSSGQLKGVTEKNINVDTLLLNFAILNKTVIKRDGAGRPYKVQKFLGTIPPTIETTDYSYRNGHNMGKTVYTKASLSFSSFSIVPSERITINYQLEVPWEGKKKYEFSLLNTIAGISIDDLENGVEKISGDVTGMNIIEQGLFMKDLYDWYKNEIKGPRWRMGDLPDVPEPFLVYKDLKWWE